MLFVCLCEPKLHESIDLFSAAATENEKKFFVTFFIPSGHRQIKNTSYDIELNGDFMQF